MIYALGDLRPVLKGNNFIAPTATVMGDVVLGLYASVWWGAVIRGDNDTIYVGDYTNIQDGAVLHTDTGIQLSLANEVTVGHMAVLHGCTIGEGSLIGIKAVVLNGAVVGRECLIGANSLIAEGKVIPDRSLVVGSPGRVLRQLTDTEVALLRASAQHYVVNADRYRQNLAIIADC